MQAQVEHLLRKASNPGEVRAVLQALCAAHGEVVRTDVMYSTQEQPPRHMTCIVEMKARLDAAIAEELGAANLGSHLLVFKYDAPENFQVQQ